MTVTLQELSDREEIRQLAQRYASACDRRDGPKLAGVFTTDGKLAKCRLEPDGLHVAAEWQGHEAIAAVAVSLKRWAATTHFLGQQTIEIDGDEASVETYCLAYHLYELETGWHNRILSIRYLDSCVRTNDVWLIKERRLVTDWIEYRAAGTSKIGPPWAVEQDALSYHLAHS